MCKPPYAVLTDEFNISLSPERVQNRQQLRRLRSTPKDWFSSTSSTTPTKNPHSTQLPTVSTKGKQIHRRCLLHSNATSSRNIYTTICSHNLPHETELVKLTLQVVIRLPPNQPQEARTMNQATSITPSTRLMILDKRSQRCRPLLICFIFVESLSLLSVFMFDFPHTKRNILEERGGLSMAI